ncbi:MAG: HAD family hydrolase [Chloroflexi bacterium]|nr:HAD family hydrolase [Chloroflexota bacterium]
MIEIDVPGWQRLRLGSLVLDLNGTLSRDGDLVDGVEERVKALRRHVDVHLLSADTFGRLKSIAERLGVADTRLHTGEPEAEQKAVFVRNIVSSRVVAIGNGANDVAMLREAAVGIAVLGAEGLAVAAVQAADVLAGSILDALDLLLHPKRLAATLRR